MPLPPDPAEPPAEDTLQYGQAPAPPAEDDAFPLPVEDLWFSLKALWIGEEPTAEVSEVPDPVWPLG